MIQLPRVGWKLLACENGASPDCIIVVVMEMTSTHVSVHKRTIPNFLLFFFFLVEPEEEEER